MSELATLYVVSSSLGDYAVDDIVSGLAWSNPHGNYSVIVVSENEMPLQLEHRPHVQMLPTRLPRDCDGGFHRAAALQEAIKIGCRFRRAVLLDDSVLIRGGSIDGWLDEHARDDIGVIGVGDSRDYSSRMADVSQLLYEWNILQGEPWDVPPTPSLSSAFLAIPYRAAKALATHGALVPEGAERWPHGYGAYLAWVASHLGFSVVAWGWTEKALPPLYVASPNVLTTAPHLLADRFMVFSSVRQVRGYGEADLREIFKRQRNEPHREVPPFAPEIFTPVAAAPDPAIGE